MINFARESPVIESLAHAQKNKTLKSKHKIQ